VWKRLQIMYYFLNLLVLTSASYGTRLRQRSMEWLHGSNTL
jgi:hypothetical protein